MFKFFNKNNFLDDLWGNFQIILDEISNSKSRINLLDKSGILISDHTNNDFTKNIKKNIKEILNEGESATKTLVDVIDDSSDMYWLILEDLNSNDLLSSLYTCINALNANDSLSNILALVIPLEFLLEETKEKIYLIYRVDTKSFYPFSPNSDDEKIRNKDNEKDLYNYLIRRKVNLENTEKKWLGIWGIPF
ncbi:MAG: hypothetical protein CL697_01375 [Chloroflexi bacterium]|nr:hypothetical protein [Chloroflexota bacterium]MQG19569.1 hypothetical protein [SAR202 cluster bacterium]MQG23951.1 hypothetical protein [SAR202 cluster bacterium]MQG43898.1 hypothetical protein [SAR202 cluster bacterium]